MSNAQLLKAALSLPARSKVQFAERLLQSLDLPEQEADGEVLLVYRVDGSYRLDARVHCLPHNPAKERRRNASPFHPAR